MTNTFNFSCQCRSMTGTVELPARKKLTRLVCYCQDCQACARYLKPSKAVLDSQGGTDLVQMSPANFHITRGLNNLGNLRLSEPGIYRWYATCCNSPLCNTPQNPAMPFVGFITRNLVGSPKTLDNRIGPVSLGVCAGPHHPVHADWPVAKGFGLKGLSRTLLNIGRWRMAGEHTRSTLIDARSGRPIREPYTLSDSERAAACSV